MTHVNDLHLLVVQDFVFSYSSIIVFLLNLMFSITYYLHLTTIICILHFSNLMCSQIIFKRCFKNCVDSFLFSLQKFVVHDLYPTCNSNNPNLTIVFFHGITFGTNDEWKETWTTRPTNNREQCICWPEKWLPEDLNKNIRILSLSYDSNIVASVHNDVTEIGKNLIQSLVTNSRCDNLVYLWTH
jgi:hypothetical protein